MARLTLTVESVTKRYGKSETPAVDGVSFGVAPGEILGILGPTGAGKSTLLKLIGGLAMPDSGDIKLSGVSLYRDYERCMEDIGFVPDRPELYPYMTGIANLRTFAAMYKDVPERVIAELISQMQLEDYIDRRVCEYPTGIRQRLAIAAALLNSPRLLVIDEALDGLDPVSVVETARLLRRLAGSFKVSAIVSSHQMSEVERMCDRIAIMEQGRLIGIGAVDHLKAVNSSKPRHKLLLDRPDEAGAFINESLGYGVEVTEDYIIIETAQGNIPQIMERLYKKGFFVYEITPIELTLEDAYYRQIKRKPGVKDRRDAQRIMARRHSGGDGIE